MACSREESVVLLTRAGDIHTLALGLGEFDRALSMLRQARELFQNTPEGDPLSHLNFYFGETARSQRRYSDPADFFSESLPFTKPNSIITGTGPLPTELRGILRSLVSRRGHER